MSNFQLAKKFTDGAERGFTVDDGGATENGITQRTYDTYRESVGAPMQDVRLMTPQEATAIQWNFFWLPGHCDSMPMRLSVCHFDCYFNSDPEDAVKILQRALGFTGDEVDGDYGPFTHAAVLACDDLHTSTAYLEERWTFMQDICKNESPTVRLNGYKNRINHLKTYLSELPNG